MHSNTDTGYESNTDADANSYINGYCYRNGHSDSDGYVHAYSDGHSNGYAYANTNADGNRSGGLVRAVEFAIRIGHRNRRDRIRPTGLLDLWWNWRWRR